jgi:hypothetical protein
MLQLRQIHFSVPYKGFRSKSITVITTLLDSKLYPRKAIAELYGLRWNAELNLRHIKITLGMDVLRCKSPEMVRKEIWMFLLAYNLIRGVMWEAGCRAGQDPSSLSFKGAQDHLILFANEFSAMPKSKILDSREKLLGVIAKDILPSRPGRVEPRCIKRRPKSFPLLTMPRKTWKKVVAA